MAGSSTAIFQHSSLWRGDTLAKVDTPSVPTGFAELDALLPGGGWPSGVLSEILLEHEGIGELSLLMPALSRLSREERYLALIAPPYIPYAPALVAHGVQLSKLIVVYGKNSADGLWAAEQCLRSGACGAVFAWSNTKDERVLRRLQLAAEAGRTFGLIYRPARFASQPSPASLRLALAPADHGLTVRILKRRGGEAGSLYLKLTRDSNLPCPAPIACASAKTIILDPAVERARV